MKKLHRGLKKNKDTIKKKEPHIWAFPHLVGVFCGEVLHWRDDALSNQLTIRGRGLLLDQLRLLAADWSKQTADTQVAISFSV